MRSGAVSRTISVIATVLNEVGSLPGWFTALESQTTRPDQVVIVDGGSTDGTWQLVVGLAESSPLRVDICRKSGASISEGRNIAIEHAQGDIIVVSDAGTRPDSNWIRYITEPFDDEQIDIVSGFFVGDRSSLWNAALVAATLPDADEIDPESFLPSSRSVAVRKRWLDAEFRYPEWLDYCEDLIFDLLLRDGGATFRWEPRAVVEFDPRSGPVSFARQYFRYARGDGKSGLFPRRHAVRYASYAVLAAALVRRKPIELIIVSVLGLAHIRRPIKRLINAPEASGLTLLLTIPLAAGQVALGDIAKMAGYPFGLAWRIQRLGLRSITYGWRSVHSRMTRS